MSSRKDVRQAGRELEGAAASEIVRWAVREFGDDVAMSSSFQTQSVPLLHIVSQVAPELTILFLDTGYHFPETLAFRDRLIHEWGLTVRNLRAERPAGSAGSTPPDLYRTDPDLCCQIHKVEPMAEATEDLTAWISGIRRDQSESRERTEIVERTDQGVVRIHPMAAWTSRDVFQYIADHDLPVHPLLSEGYPSVGCAPCTAPVSIDKGGQRSGRWAGRDKTECGLHTELRAEPPAGQRQGHGSEEG